MTNTTVPRAWADVGRRFGYAIAAALNAALYFVASHILEWEWPGFVTTDFDRVDEIVLLSLAAAVFANLVYVWNDTMPLKAFMEMTLNSVSLVATIRLWQVFPFDFSQNSFDWTTITRIVIGIAMIGTSVALVVNLVKGVRGLLTS